MQEGKKMQEAIVASIAKKDKRWDALSSAASLLRFNVIKWFCVT